MTTRSKKFNKDDYPPVTKSLKKELQSNGIFEERMYSAYQLAEILSVTERTVYGWKAAGKIPYIQIGSVIRFDGKVLNEKFAVWPEDMKPVAAGEAAAAQ